MVCTALLATMTANAFIRVLTAADVEALAAWYARQTWPAAGAAGNKD